MLEGDGVFLGSCASNGVPGFLCGDVCLLIYKVGTMTETTLNVSGMMTSDCAAQFTGAVIVVGMALIHTR